jgi:DNA segregation ATPase FtsK/SpoIIIE-like protein
MDILQIVTGLAGLTGATWLATYALQSIHDRIYDRYWQWQNALQSHQAREQEIRLASVRVLQPDGNGRAGVAYDGRVYRDLDSRAVFEQAVNLWFDPMLEKLNAIQKTVLALQAGAVSTPQRRALVEQVSDVADQAQPWPARVELTDLLATRSPSINSLIVGARPGDNGLDVVTLSIHDMMHTLTVGASGWGKSVWLRSLLYQVALAPEPVDVALVDVYGSEFNLARNWDRLRWPVAREASKAAGVLQAVSREIARRKQLYEDNAPTAANLPDYNRATGVGLPPLLVVVDEGTALLNEAGISEPLRQAVQTARQYGVYVLLAGQSANHQVIPTQVRDNFSSRLCFRTSPASSRVVLDDRRATELQDKGRMLAQLSGQELQELQGPFVTRQQLEQVLTGSGPAEAAPEVDVTRVAAEENGVTEEEIDRVRELRAQGWGLTNIAQEVFGARGGKPFYTVKDILAEWDSE